VNKSLKKWKNDLKKKNYKLFLKSKYWKEVRLVVYKRDNYKCVYCGSKEKIQAHHLTYKNHYKEHKNLQDLITLCEKCHKSEHEWEIKKKSLKK
jgi:5-methylcytosine-specific restriction endonuclease McrA